ncbi:MAG: Fe-S cluster assembly protein SufD [Bacteriovoracaceae bacterium]
MNKETLLALAEKKISQGPESLKDFRLTHLHLFKDHGFKTPGEFYQYTHIEKFFNAFEVSSQKIEIDLTLYTNHSIPTLYFIDGKLQEHSLKIAGLKVGKISENFSQIANDLNHSNALTNLHHALLEDGVYIEVEKNAEIKTPLRLLYLFTQNEVCAPTVFIKAGKFSKLSLIESSIGPDLSYSQIAETYLKLDEGSKLEHIQLDQGSAAGLHHASTYVEVSKDASYKNLIFHLGAKLNRKNLDLKLLSAGANGESYNLFLTEKDEHSDINTVIHHLFADTTSNQLAKGILDDESRGVFTGKIFIHPKAQRVASGQLNKNLLLSKKAQIHSQPQLEIFADDVKCSHGSTTGQLSEDEIFYFEARGIPAERAKTLLAHGFGMEVVLKIENEEMRKLVSEAVLEKLKTKFKI